MGCSGSKDVSNVVEFDSIQPNNLSLFKSLYSSNENADQHNNNPKVHAQFESDADIIFWKNQVDQGCFDDICSDGSTLDFDVGNNPENKDSSCCGIDDFLQELEEYFNAKNKTNSVTKAILSKLNNLPKEHHGIVSTHIRENDPSTGCMLHMMGLLRSFDPVIRKKASVYFVHFFHNNSKNKAYVRKFKNIINHDGSVGVSSERSSVFDGFIELLEDKSAVCIENGLRIIKSLALDVSNQPLLIQAIPILIALLKTQFASTRRLALSALWAVCYDTPSNRVAIGARAAGGIEALLQILQCRKTYTPVDKECMCSAAGVCMRLAIDSENEAEFQRVDAIRILVSLLNCNASPVDSRCSPEYMSYVLGTLWLLAYDNQENRVKLWHCNGVSVLLDILNQCKVCECRRNSARALRRLVLNADVRKGLMSQNGSVKFLMRFLKSEEDPIVLCHVTGTIAVLLCDPEGVVQFVNNGGVVMLVALLDQSQIQIQTNLKPPLAEVRETTKLVCGVLFNLCGLANTATAMGECDGVFGYLDLLLGLSDIEISSLVCGILWKLSAIRENRRPIIEMPTVLDRMISILKLDSSPELKHTNSCQLYCLKCLACLCMEVSSVDAVGPWFGTAIPLFLLFFNHVDVEYRRGSSVILYHLASSDEGIYSIRIHGGVAILFQLLSMERDVATCRYVVGTIRKMCLDSGSVELIDICGVSELSKLLMSDDVDTVRHATGCFRNMAAFDFMRMSLQNFKDSILHIVGLLSHDDVEVRQHAAAAVDNLANDNEINKKIIFQGGGIQKLVNMLVESDPDILFNALGALWTNMRGFRNSKGIVIENSGVEKCLQLLRSDYGKMTGVVSNAIGCLRSLCLEYDCQKILIEQGFKSNAVPTLLQFLTWDSTNIENIVGILRVLISVHGEACSYVVSKIYENATALTVLANTDTEDALIVVQQIVEKYPDAAYFMKQSNIAS